MSDQIKVGPQVDYVLFSSTTETLTLKYAGAANAELVLAMTDEDSGRVTARAFRVDPDDLLRAVDTMVVAKKHADQKNNPPGAMIPGRPPKR